MSLDEVKSAAFRYCDKVFLAAVVLFVALKVYSHVSPSQETVGSLGPVSGGQTVEIPTGKPDFRSPAAKPFADIPSPFVVEHDPFWPQQVVRLRPVSLRLPRKGLQEPDKKAKLTDTRTLPAKLVGRLVPWTPPDEFLQLIDPDRERRLASRADLRTPCKVNVAVDRDTRTILTFEAVAAGDWIGYEGNLENKNKVRVVVIVEPADLTPPQVVRRAIVDEVREESLGRVVLRFHLEVPEQATPRAATPAQPPNVQYVEPTYYLIYRKGPLDEKSRVIGRLEGKGLIRAPTSPTDLRRPRRMELQPEGEPPMDMGPPPPTRRRPGTWPRGMPGVAPRRMTPEEAMEGGMPGERIPGMPVPGEMMPPAGDQRRQPTRARATRAGELVFIDSSVESETTYTYWVETVGIRENGKPLESKKCCLKGNTCPGHEITTLKKFSFAYIGNRRMKDGTVSAKIMVFIGSRDDPLEWRTFVVPPGGRIGDLPAEPGALDEETPPAEKPPQPRPAAAPAGGEVVAAPDVEAEGPPLPSIPPSNPAAAGEEGEPSASYITRHVLVDIVPDAVRLYVRETAIARNGRMVKVNSYQYVPKPKVIIRDRKNRLIELWHERPPKPAGTRKTRDKTRPTRRRPDEMMEDMAPPEMMEGLPVPPDRPRQPRRTPRRPRR